MPKEAKNKKENKHFFKDFKAELKKVIWPTPKQLINNTVAVISIVLITAVIVFVLDLAFEKANTYGVNKLKTIINSNEVLNETEGNEVNDEVSEANTENTENEETTDVTESSQENVSE